MEEITRLAPQIGKSLVSTKKLLSFFKEVINQINVTLRNLDALEADTKEVEDALLDCRTFLDKMRTKADGPVQILKNFLDFGYLKQRKREGILRKFRNGDYSALNAYLKQLKKCLDKCKDHHKEFQKLKDQIIVKISNIMEDCEKKVKEASWGGTYKQIGDLKSSAGAAVRDGYVTRAVINAAASISEFGKSIVSSVTNA